jgi:hypothetical protein
LSSGSLKQGHVYDLVALFAGEQRRTFCILATQRWPHIECLAIIGRFGGTIPRRLETDDARALIHPGEAR